MSLCQESSSILKTVPAERQGVEVHSWLPSAAAGRLSLWGRLSPTNRPGDRVIQVLFGTGVLYLGLAEYVDGALALGSVGKR